MGPDRENPAAVIRKKAILFCSRGNLRAAIRKSLGSFAIDEVDTPETKEECIDMLERQPDSLFIVDWAQGEKITSHLLKCSQLDLQFKKRPTLLIANEASNTLWAVATEFRVSRVHIGEISMQSLGEHLQILDHLYFQPSTTSAISEKVRKNYLEGNFEEAIKLLVHLIKANPEEPMYVSEYINILIKQDKWKKAHKYALHFYNRFPDNPRGAHFLGRCLLKFGKVEEAASYLEAANEQNPFNINRLVDLGNAMFQLGATKEAKRNFEEALSLDQDSKEAKIGNVKCMLSEDQINEAMHTIGKFCSELELASMFNSVAILKTRQLKFHEAYKLYQCAVKICENDNRVRAKLLFNLGLGMQKCNHLDQAAKFFQKSIEADPNFKWAKGSLKAIHRKTAEIPGETFSDMDEGTGDLIEPTVIGDSDPLAIPDEMSDFEHERFSF